MNLLECRDITVKFGGLSALQDISLDVPRNSTIGIIGPNGSGKTTFFNTLTGIYAPSKGYFRFGDKIFTCMKPHQIARLGIARTYQNSRLFLNLSVLENVLIGRQRLRRSIFATKDLFREHMLDEIKKAYSVLKLFGRSLAENWDISVSNLNQGDRRKVEICRALAAEPDLLLLDEPSAGLDPSETQDLMNDLLQIRNEQKELTIIIVEHNMQVIKKLAEHVVVFDEGIKIVEGTYTDVVSNAYVRKAYLGVDQI